MSLGGRQLIQSHAQHQAGKGRKLSKGLSSDSYLLALLPKRNSGHAKLLIYRGFSESVLRAGEDTVSGKSKSGG